MPRRRRLPRLPRTTGGLTSAVLAGMLSELARDADRKRRNRAQIEAAEPERQPQVDMDTQPVILVGAGASVPFGIPDMKRFSQRFRKEIKSGLEKTSLEYKILHNISREFRLKGDYDDLELLMELLQSLASIVTMPASRLLMKRLRRMSLKEHKEILTAATGLDEELRRYVRITCTRFALDTAKQIYGEFLKPLAGFCRKPLLVFTTNYDTIIETCCDLTEIGLEVVDGFAATSSRRPATWNPYQFMGSSGDVHLFKLHGSIDWYQQDGEFVRIPAITNVAATGQSLREMLIYPRQTAGILREPFAELYSQLRTRLKTPRRTIIVVGYSFRDVHILDILRSALALHKEARLWIVDSRASVYLDRFTGFRSKVTEVEGDFGQVSTISKCVDSVKRHMSKK